VKSASVSRSIEPARQPVANPFYQTRELRRVAAAATLNIAGIVAVVLLLMPIVGYNSTAQALPKSMLDGAILAMLVGSRGRWRSVALFGVVVGLFLAFVIPAIPPLALVYALAGAAAMAAGFVVDRLHRRLAVAACAGVFATLAGAGIAVQVYFASHDAKEPFLWSLVGLEIALRAVGAPVGTLIGWSWLKRMNERRASDDTDALARSTVARRTVRRVRMSVSPAYTLVVLAAAMLGCTLPMFIESGWMLAGLAMSYAVLAIAVNQGRCVLSVLAVMTWGWAFYGGASYLWHQDPQRVLDFGRTLVLRFFPMATIALVMIRTVRPVAVLRLLRRARVSGAVLLPLAMVLRTVPNARREIVAGIDGMKASGQWDGRLTPLKHPIRVSRGVIGPLIRRWGGMLSEPVS
jgi:hypothetical protein